jgi:hypothetical protein
MAGMEQGWRYIQHAGTNFAAGFPQGLWGLSARQRVSEWLPVKPENKFWL